MKILKEKTVRVKAIPVNPKEVILLEKRVLHRVHTIHTAILIPPGETILMMFIINSGGIKWRILYVMEIFYIRKV